MENFKGTEGDFKINPVETYHCDIGIMSPLIKEGKIVKGGFTFDRLARLDFKGSEVTEANAALMAGSKDMLKALTAIRDFKAHEGQSYMEIYKEMKELADEVIKKVSEPKNYYK